MSVPTLLTDFKRNTTMVHGLIALCLLLTAVAGCRQQVRSTDDSTTAFVKTVSAAEFESIVESESRLVVVDFYADWCGPCRLLSPILETVAEANQDTTRIIKVDIDQERELAGALNIQSIPYVRLYKDGKHVDEFVGLIPEEEIRRIVNTHAGRGEMDSS